MPSLKECIKTKKRINAIGSDFYFSYSEECNKWFKMEKGGLVDGQNLEKSKPLVFQTIENIETELKTYHDMGFILEIENNEESLILDFDI